jgi:DNA polymerase III delta prime subunit
MAQLHIDPLPRNATPGEVLRFVAGVGKVDGKKVGKILFLGNAARVEVPDGSASQLVAALDGATFRERPVRARLASAPPPGSQSAHFDHLARLLKLEAEAERDQLKERAARGAAGDGTSLTALVVTEEDAGLGGRLILTFARVNRHEQLPPNRLGPGSPVQVTQTGTTRPAVLRGVVSDRAERTIAVAFEQTDAVLPDDAGWRIDLSPDEASRQRQLGALARAGAADGDRLAELRDVLLGEREPTVDGAATGRERLGPPSRSLPVAAPLNAPQLAAVEFALAAQDVAVIHGPPGTGKTTTVVELIRRAVANGEKVLACAPSNAAVDNLLDKLLTAGLEPVRLGHPARVAPALRDRALDVLVESHPDARQARKYTREATALFRKADKWSKARPLPGEKQALRAEAKQLLTDARRMEQLAVDRVLDAAAVVCATLTGIDSETLGQRRFDLAVLDEACQSTEPASWVPLLRAGRVVFAGDPCQLPPTVLSPEAADRGLAVSLMERAMALLGPGVSRLLTVQYRMHADVMGFSSAEFYGGELVADASVVGHRLCDLPGVRAEPLTEGPLTFVDTAGAGYDEEAEEDTESRLNPREAALAATYVRRLLDAGVSPGDVAVIAPYAGQVRRLRELLRGLGVEVDSVDGFQGREKEAVVISLVRSNPEGEIGFLGDVRRTNVALTRARRKLVVVGDSATLSHHPFYGRLLTYVEDRGGYRSVWEEESA